MGVPFRCPHLSKWHHSSPGVWAKIPGVTLDISLFLPCPLLDSCRNLPTGLPASTLDLLILRFILTRSWMQSFSTWALLAFQAAKSLWWGLGGQGGVCSVHCRTLSSVAGLHPQDGSSISPVLIIQDLLCCLGRTVGYNIAPS